MWVWVQCLLFSLQVPQRVLVSRQLVDLPLVSPFSPSLSSSSFSCTFEPPDPVTWLHTCVIDCHFHSTDCIIDCHFNKVNFDQYLSSYRWEVRSFVFHPELKQWTEFYHRIFTLQQLASGHGMYDGIAIRWTCSTDAKIFIFYFFCMCIYNQICICGLECNLGLDNCYR